MEGGRIKGMIREELSYITLKCLNHFMGMMENKYNMDKAKQNRIFGDMIITGTSQFHITDKIKNNDKLD